MFFAEYFDSSHGFHRTRIFHTIRVILYLSVPKEMECEMSESIERQASSTRCVITFVKVTRKYVSEPESLYSRSSYVTELTSTS